MRILVSGSSGFIGRKLLPALSKHTVLALSKSRQVQRGVASHLCNLRDPASWRATVQRFSPEACIHLAWEGLPDYSMQRCAENRDLSIAFLNSLVAMGVGRVVVAGSCWEYGDRQGPLSEDMSPVNPGAFARAKLEILSWLQDISRSSSCQYRWGRIFFSYGSGQRETSLIPATHAAARRGEKLKVKSPDTVQDFVHIDDVVGALGALVATDVPSGIYNIGSGKAYMVSTVADAVAARYGLAAKTPLLPLDAGRGFWSVSSKLRQATGWTAKVPLEQGIESTLEELDSRT